MKKPRPYIICHMLLSSDGKSTGDFLLSKESKYSLDEYFRIHRESKVDGFICGRVTMEESFTNCFYPILTSFQPQNDCKDYVASGNYKYYAIAFDRNGRLGWQDKVIHDLDNGYNDAHIVEVLTQKADLRYLSYLQSIGVSYIFAGKKDIDINLALYKLKKYFSINNLLLEGGPTINEAFLKSKCIDELSLITAPITSNSVFDKNLFETSDMRNFVKMSEVLLDRGVLYQRYKFHR